MFWSLCQLLQLSELHLRIVGPEDGMDSYIFQEHHCKIPVLQRYGSLIHHLSCRYLDKDTAKAVARLCPSVQSLYLQLDLNSFYVHHDALEQMFIGLRDRLTRLHIRFDAAIFSPTIL
ncbi:hypothetical protein BGX29_004673 [Mortierella sp. GBA35]|nr:hypothetical protein BGX29_004673 [Mortierella sp. GBA35]